MGLASGNVLDRYVIESLLGSGAMGRVYRATDRRLRRAVALKVIEGAGAETHVALREARAAAAIVHPNVTAVYDVDHAGGTSYIVMELVPGTPLRKLVGDASVPLPERLRWLVEVAAALAAAHQAGVIHRDVKPENVILREDGLIKVLDFGVARFASAATPALGIHGLGGAAAAQSSLAGTPAYMAPEQITGTFVDGRTDQFAWGVMAYELCAGRLPWTQMNGPFGVLSAILDEVPEPLPDDVPAAVAAAVSRALSKRPEGRFPSMIEAAAALVPFLAGPAPVLGRSPDSHTRARAEEQARVPPLPDGPPPAAPAADPPEERAPASDPQIAPLAYSVAPPPVEAEPAAPPPPSTATLSSGMRPIAAPPPPAPEPLRAPETVAPVDLEAHLALLPEDASCKGMFFLDLIRAARGRPSADLHAQAGLPDRRYLAFRDYPTRDHLRLAVASARVAHPGLPLGLSLRRLGQSAGDAVLGSHIGKTLLGVHGRDPAALLLALPKAFQLLWSFGEITVAPGAAGVFALRARGFPVFLETFQVGVIEATLRYADAHARLRVALESLGEGQIEIAIA